MATEMSEKWTVTPMEVSEMLIWLQSCDKTKVAHRWNYLQCWNALRHVTKIRCHTKGIIQNIDVADDMWRKWSVTAMDVSKRLILMWTCGKPDAAHCWNNPKSWYDFRHAKTIIPPKTTMGIIKTLEQLMWDWNYSIYRPIAFASKLLPCTSLSIWYAYPCASTKLPSSWLFKKWCANKPSISLIRRLGRVLEEWRNSERVLLFVGLCVKCDLLILTQMPGP